jgi:hypothetical protein
MPVGNGHATDEAGGGVPLVTTNNDGQGGSNLTHRRQVRLRLGRRAARAAKSKRSASSDSAASSLSSNSSGGSSLGSLAAACAPLPAGALRRLAVEERQRWRRPRHLPWRRRRRPSPASTRAPAQHGSPSIAMRHVHPAPPGRLHHLPGRRATGGRHRRSASATPRPAGRFAVAPTRPKGCSGPAGEAHPLVSLRAAAHREQDTEMVSETRHAQGMKGGPSQTVVVAPRHRDTRRVTPGTGRVSGRR